ncbi:glycosyltransferase [Phocaeicola sp.]
MINIIVMIKISVIVPIYNVDKYLSRCLDSILNQTYQDLEIILINDGSTDNSLAIMDNYSKKDKRIILISQKNGGLSLARNIGLSKATGDYIAFVDGDDWIEPYMFQELALHIIQEQSDFVCFRLQFDNHLLGKQSVYGHRFGLQQLSGKDIIKDTLLVRNITTSAWSKIYKRIFLKENNLLFEPGIVNEDTLFSIQVACCAQKVTFVNRVFYHAVEREGSISRSFHERLFQDMAKALEIAQDYMVQKGIFDSEIIILYRARYMKSFLYNIMQMAQRLVLDEYMRIYSLCISDSKYLMYNNCKVRKMLPMKHRGMLIISRFPHLCFFTVRILNAFSYRMH